MHPAEILPCLAAGDAACAPEHPLGAMLRGLVPEVAAASRESAALRLVPVLAGREPFPADVAGLSAMVLASAAIRQRLFWEPLRHPPAHTRDPDDGWRAFLAALVACVASPVAGSDVSLLAPDLLVEMLASAPTSVRPAVVDDLVAALARGHPSDRVASRRPRLSRTFRWAPQPPTEDPASVADRAVAGLAWHGLRAAAFLTTADLHRILTVSARSASSRWPEIVEWLAHHPAGTSALWCAMLEESPEAAEAVAENPVAMTSPDVRAMLWYLAAGADRDLVAPWLPARGDGHHPADVPRPEDEPGRPPVPPLRDAALARGDGFYGPLLTAATDPWEWRTILHLLAQHAPQAFEAHFAVHGAVVLATAPDAAASWLQSPQAAVRAFVIAALGDARVAPSAASPEASRA